MLEGRDPLLQLAPRSGATFADAANEWLRYIEHDRKRERSTVLGYRKAVEARLLPTFGSIPLERIDAAMAERWRQSLLAAELSANTVNKLRWKAEAIYKRAMRVWACPRTRSRTSSASHNGSPASSTSSPPTRSCCWRPMPATTRTRRSTPSPGSRDCAWASSARCAGGTSRSRIGWSTSSGRTRAGRSRRRSPAGCDRSR